MIVHKQEDSSAITLACDGLYSKACQTLTSSGIVNNSEETWRLLVAKHPKSPLPVAPPSPPITEDPIFPPNFNIIGIHQSFPKLTAAGPSGMRIQHLIDAAGI